VRRDLPRDDEGEDLKLGLVDRVLVLFGAPTVEPQQRDITPVERRRWKQVEYSKQKIE
jgi:hypothetical protein